MCETMQSSHRLCPVMALVRAFLEPTVSGDGAGARFCVPLPPSPHFSAACPERTGFGVTFNDVTKDTAFYTTTSRFVTWLGAFSQERQELWLPKDDLRDSSSWSSPPLMLLRDIHSKLLNQFDYKEVCASSPSQVNTGASGGLSSQDGVPQ